jgi:hypothetical protein
MGRHVALIAALAAVCTLPYAALAAELPDPPVLRGWISDMKASDRGPFRRIRWFCNDGTVLPPKAYACVPHGGGVQHGEWSDRVRQLRAGGYQVANVLADLDVEALLAQPDHKRVVGQIMVEQFLIAADDGWILRKARFYRGALQDEDERAGARRLLLGLAADPAWTSGQGYLALRSAAGLLRHGEDSKSVAEVRRLSAALAEQAGDAAKVRDYAAQLAGEAARADYERLAAAIDAVCRRRGSRPTPGPTSASPPARRSWSCCATAWPARRPRPSSSPCSTPAWPWRASTSPPPAPCAGNWPARPAASSFPGSRPAPRRSTGPDWSAPGKGPRWPRPSAG